MADNAPDLTRLHIDRNAAPARGGRAGWLVALILFVLLLLHAAWREGWLGDVVPGAQPAVRVGRVRVEGGEALVASSGTSANGYVVARTRAALSTEIQGRIVKMLVEEGQAVEEGELIAKLDTSQLEATLATAQADLARARADLDLAELEYARREALVGTGDVRLSERDMSLAERDAKAALVHAGESRVDETRVLLRNSSIYAPFAGVITAKNAEVGEVVSAIGATGPNARGAVATLVDFSTLEVQVELAQTALAGVELNAPALIHLDAYPEAPYRGRVRQIWPTANRQKATVELRVVFLERDDRILPEMGVRVVFLPKQADSEETPERSVWVPAAAVRARDDATSVLVLVDGALVERAVELDAEAVGARRRVRSGLEGNERVVLEPAPELTDGQRVRVDSDS